jgi:hypothetical protein
VTRTLKKSNQSYSTIDDFPLYNWGKCQSGDMRYVNRDAKSTKYDEIIWLKLYNEYLERFGIGEGLEYFLKLKIHLVKLRLQFIQTNDLFLLNQIKVAEAQMISADPSKLQGMTTQQCLVHLSKWMGTIVRAKEITIVEFKEMFEEYARSSKKE